MRRFMIVGATLALVLGGAMVVSAASPSPAPSTRPTASPTPSATPRSTTSPAPSASAAPSGAATTEPTFSATVQPLQVAGSATVAEQAGGAGVVTLKISGLVDNQRWTVDIDGGTFAMPNERVEVAFKSGTDVTRLGTDTVQIHLTKAEMAAFVNADKAGGVVAFVSDGSRLGYAEFSAS